jgi:hypothetical protein
MTRSSLILTFRDSMALARKDTKCITVEGTKRGWMFTPDDQPGTASCYWLVGSHKDKEASFRSVWFDRPIWAHSLEGDN